MSKHRKMSERSVRMRTLVGGLMAGGALAVTLPTGLAHADTTNSNANSKAADAPAAKPTTGNKSADAVGRPGFGYNKNDLKTVGDGNPAPGVRAAQAIGDKVFNQKPGINKQLDDSPLGEAYHANFGTANYDDPTKGTNGAIQGELNVNAGKYYYDQTQKYSKQYLGDKVLLDEKDLPGTLPKGLAAGNGQAQAPKASAKKAGSCTTSGSMKLSAQAASC